MPPSIPTPSARPPCGRVLVTGGAGFVGAALCRELAGRGVRALALDDLSGGRRERLGADPRIEFVRGDAGDPALLEGLAHGGQPILALVHLAAVVGVRRVLADPEGCRAEHLRLADGLEAALCALPAERRPRLYAASTSEVYAESPAPLAEDAALRPTGGVGRWAYAASKLSVERRLDALAPLWPAGRAPIHLRLFNVVGPGQDADGGMVLPRFVERARAGLPLEVHGDGAQVRTFAHVDEVARALADLVLRGDAPAGPLNVGGRARTTVAALAERVRDAAGSPSEIVRVDPRRACAANFEDVRHRVPDLARLEALGLSVPALGLDAIVRDCLARHPRGAAAGAGRNACASPAS